MPDKIAVTMSLEVELPNRPAEKFHSMTFVTGIDPSNTVELCATVRGSYARAIAPGGNMDVESVLRELVRRLNQDKLYTREDFAAMGKGRPSDPFLNMTNPRVLASLLALAPAEERKAALGYLIESGLKDRVCRILRNNNVEI